MVGLQLIISKLAYTPNAVCLQSSLLSAILGELPVLSGDLTVRGDFSYAAQTPWIFSGTLRDNILFGTEFDAERYKKTIKACCLTKVCSSQ